MANKKRPTPKPRAKTPSSAPVAPPPPPPKARSKAPWFIAGGVAVVVVIAAIIAIAAGGGDDDNAAQDTSTTAAVGPTAPTTTIDPTLTVPPGEYQDVTVTGASLDRYDSDASSDPAIGTTPPTLQGFTFDGAPITIDPSAGKATMVVFVAHWCPHCNREVPRLVDWYESGKVPADLQVIGVSTSAQSSAPNWPPSKWLADKGWPWPVLVDSQKQDAAFAYGLPSYPYFVVFDASGKVVARQSGELPIEDIQQIVDRAVA